MAAEQRILKQDGYVEVGSGDGSIAKSITYHPQLNVILLFDSNNHVKIMDIHSGVILQTYNLNDDAEAADGSCGTDAGRTVCGRYLPLQEKMLFWDGHKLGFRSDYNGVFLLNTILQTPIRHNDDLIRLEMLLSEANIFYTCVKDLEQEGLECPSDVANELLERIKYAQLNQKKSIKAQRWTTICLEVSYASLKLLAGNVVNLLKRLERHIPALAIASAIYERLTDLMVGGRSPELHTWPGSNFQRILMHSEAVRRQTFEKWPHMDYKWALPDQMAQAGFYHQPSSSGEDRAMCFTCSVCLVCWEKTDEPWGEHERHSPMCPFVKGEYTQNVPLTLTYATSPAVTVAAPDPSAFDVISNSDYANVLCTSCSRSGEIVVWSIERHLKQMHSFNLSAIMREICDDGAYEWARVTSICVLPNARAKYKVAAMEAAAAGKSSSGAAVTAASGSGNSGSASLTAVPASSSSAHSAQAAQAMTSTSTLRAGVVDSKIILGISIQHSSGEHQLRMVVLNVVESDRSSETGTSGAAPNQVAGESEGSLHENSKNVHAFNEGDDGCDHPMEEDDNDDDELPPPLPVPPVFAKYADGFDSNGFVSDMLAMKKTIEDGMDLDGGGVPNNYASKNAEDAPDEMLKTLLLKHNLMMKNYLSKLPPLLNSSDKGYAEGGSSGGGGGGPSVKTICISADLDANGMTADEFKQKLIAATKEKYKAFKVAKSKELNNNINGASDGSPGNTQSHHQLNNNALNNNNNSLVSLTDDQTAAVSEEIDCVIESWTTVQRTNALASPSSSSAVELASQSSSYSANDETAAARDFGGPHHMQRRDREIVEIAEIMPTNSSCNQLLVKLLKTKAPPAAASKIIMANVEELDDDEHMDLDDGSNGDCVAAQLLLFDCVNSVISSEYLVGMTFSRTKCPQQLCLLPHFQSEAASTAALGLGDASDQCLVAANKGGCPATQEGALAVVCADGSIEIYSLSDFQSITTLAENSEHFVSVAYCRNLERLCACTRDGDLFFYSLNAEAENEFGEEVLEMDEECQAANLLNLKQSGEVSVTDGKKAADAADESVIEDAVSKAANLTDGTSEHETISIDCSGASAAAGSSATSGGSTASVFTLAGSQLSPSPASSGSNLLAYKAAELSADDLRQLHSLTLFDDNMAMFSAEVPSCWNDLVQAQKQRKQSQPMRPGDDSQFVKTWRLHNDATTWDEHIIELNLTQPVCVGHIDLRFSLFQQCHSTTAIQVTLLKQNANNFGYRMRGSGGAPHVNFKLNTVDESADAGSDASGSEPSTSGGCANSGKDTAQSSGGAASSSAAGTANSTLENPVISEEYLQTHNAEVLAGPIELNNCVDLSESAGTVTLTSPKLLKTRTRNFLIHIKTMGDPSREGQCKTRGCDWLHEISITVRGVKQQHRLPNERVQRIAMLESNLLLENLFRIVSNPLSTILSRNLALDILNWICFIRLNRFRSPKSERIKTQINKSTAASNPDLLAQQFECISLAEKYLQDTIRYCIIRSDRFMAHKCVKLLLILTEGSLNLPVEVQEHCMLEEEMRDAILGTFNDLPYAKYASAVRWYSLLALATSTHDSHGRISKLCVKLLDTVLEETNKRWEPYGALLGTRFGLYGYPFEPEIFDYDLPNVNNKGSLTSSSLVNILRSGSGMQSVNTDLKKLCSIDGVDFRTFPHLIRCKTVSNQLRGLLEVQQLHFSCVITSEATRIDNVDNVSQHGGNSGGSGSSLINVDDLIMMQPLQSMDGPKDGDNSEKLYDFVNNVNSSVTDKYIKNVKKFEAQPAFKPLLEPNGIGSDAFNPQSPNVAQFIIPTAISVISKGGNGGSKTIAAVNQVGTGTSTNTGIGTGKISASTSTSGLPALPKDSAKVNAPPPGYAFSVAGSKQASSTASSTTSSTKSTCNDDSAAATTSAKAMADAAAAAGTGVFAWHKLLAPPSKQVIVIDRMHSGARRFVVLDFGSPILLTDVVIPMCEELASLQLDIWCFDEENDGVRLVNAPDIGSKTLVLSDIQPPPICRFIKITIIGRVGLSSTKCKIPIGSFYGHVVLLSNDSYGDQLHECMNSSPLNVQQQIKALNTLYEDVHCRYSLASCKLMELLTPILNCELTNLAHMQAFINKQRDEETNNMAASSSNVLENARVLSTYEECMLLQQQVNTIRNVVRRLELHLDSAEVNRGFPTSIENALRMASRDKLRILGQTLVEIMLHFSFEFGIKNIAKIHPMFTLDFAQSLFHALIVNGDAHIQLATCSLMVRMCCFQKWWGDFLMDIFCNLFSSQNSKIFAQDRIFFLLTYLGRRTIAMGTCRSNVIDAVLKTLAKLLAPMSPRYESFKGQEASAFGEGIWAKADLQLITWLLLFVSVCLDDNQELKDKSANRWDFMSCETDFTKARSQSHNVSGKNLRCFKKRIIQNNKYSSNVQPYTDWGKKILMIQNEHPTIFMEFSSKPKSTKPIKPPPSSASTSKPAKEAPVDSESNFDKGLKQIHLDNILIVIRGLIALLLEMDFTCNMDQFLLTCKIIARLVSACRPTVQLSKIITTVELEQLVRLAVWNDQQQPWAVHAITCLLQDLLDADKQYKDNDSTPTNDTVRPMEGVQDASSVFNDYASTLYMLHSMNSMPASNNNTSSNMNTKNTDINQYADGASNKYSYLPSLIECDDTEFNEEFNEIHDIAEFLERNKAASGTSAAATKRDGSSQFNKNTFNYYCKSVSNAMDARLDANLDLNTEIHMRRLTAMSSLDMYASLPQIFTNEFVTTLPDPPAWPEYIYNVWSGPEYDVGQNTYVMFKGVFDFIFFGLHLEDTWVHLEQVLQMWLTLNGELSDKPFSAGISQSDVPTIPFGGSAVAGLLSALAWHNDIKLRTWCLGFQCLFLACNSQPVGEDDSQPPRIHEVIINDENFEKMLHRFFSGFGMSSSIITNRCAGPTICKHLHELLLLLHKKSDGPPAGVISWRRKLKDSLLNVVLQLVQPCGAIFNQQGPIDAQSQLVRDLLQMPNEKTDLHVCLNIIESVSFLVHNNISNGEKWQCQRNGDSNNTANTFSSLFANVLGSESVKTNNSISENSLIISLLKLSSTLAQMELPRQPSEVPIPEHEELITESQTDETKAEQLNIDGQRVNPLIVDTVLRHLPTMKRLLGALSNCSIGSITLLATSVYTGKPTYLMEEPQSPADAVFNLLLVLSEKASNPRLIVSPICQYLEASGNMHDRGLPRLQLSEPLLWFISKVLEMPVAVQIFTQMGGIKIICQNLVKLNRTLLNMQPGLISLIMQHMTKHSRFKLNAHMMSNASAKKTTANTAQQQRHLQEGVINFAPFCSISSEHETAQSANILIMNPVASHRRPRTPAWSYTFYPNESYMDLTITLPTAVLLKEIQLTPHGPSLATCPSAVALEISRDYGLGHIPVGPPLVTTGMTLIRLKLAKPEVATSLVLRLYRPKDSSNIGLSQISILGNTIFASPPLSSAAGSSNASSCGPLTAGYGSLFDKHSTNSHNDEDSIAKTSVGWVRILSRCFNAATLTMDPKLTADVIGTCAGYAGFVETCCSLMNIIPIMPSGALTNLQSVMLQLGEYSRELNISLIKTLLNNTIPQTYKLSNDSICDLLYDLATMSDAYTRDKMQVLLDWVCALRHTFGTGNTAYGVRCNNPQSGFVKCIASILWAVQTNPGICTDSQNLNLQELISQEVYEACVYWLDMFTTDEPLKVAFDSLLCSLCSIKPSLFHQLLAKVNVKMKRPSSEVGSETAAPQELGPERPPSTSYTDDDKNAGNAGVAPDDSLAALLDRPVFLHTLAMACQSLAAVSILVDSGLPKLLANAICQFCTEAQRNAEATGRRSAAEGGSTAMDLGHVPKILDFFSECCAEGCMRNWLGTRVGSVFWKPLLELLCNSRPLHMLNFAPDAEPRQQAFIRMERATINFFTRATTCHPTNQKTLAKLMIEVIGKAPLPLDEWGNPDSMQYTFENVRAGDSISGFTRQMILQFLLENERILVSVRSGQALQPVAAVGGGHGGSASGGVVSGSGGGVAACNTSTASNYYCFQTGGSASALSSTTPATSSANAVTLAPVNHHPEKRVSANHLLFSVSVNAKCMDIIQNCMSVNFNLFHPLTAEALNADTPINPSGSGGGPAGSHLRSTTNSVLNEQKSMMDTTSGGGSSMYGFPLYFNAFNSFNGGGMEMVSSVAAGVTAKDKRIKEAKNHTVSSAKDDSFPSSEYRGIFNMDGFGSQSNISSFTVCAQFVHPKYPKLSIPNETTVSQVLGALYSKGHSLATPCLTLTLIPANTLFVGDFEEKIVNAFVMDPLVTPLQHFANYGGLSLLAQYLPTVYPDMANRKPSAIQVEKEKSPPMTDWVKLEGSDEIYEDLEDPLTEPTTKQTQVTPVPQHSLAAFGLFLRLPMYSAVLLRDKTRAQCLLRLVLGVTSDGEGNDIYSMPLAATLPTMPFEVFRQLLDNTPLKQPEGMKLREMVVDVGAMHLVLNCLSVFTHQSQYYQGSSPQATEASGFKTSAAAQVEETAVAGSAATSDDKSHVYWAKGTGFGTGSTAQSWNVEQALMRQKSEEEHVTVLLQVLSSYINPGESQQYLFMDTDSDSEANAEAAAAAATTAEEACRLPEQFRSLLEKSCLIPALSSYLRNDSVLDITRHIPLYRAILQLLRALALAADMVGLLQPVERQCGESSSPSIPLLLANMQTCVDTYARRLKVNKKSNLKGQTNQVVVNIDDGDDEGLALLIPDIHDTTEIVQKNTRADELASQLRREQAGEQSAASLTLERNKLKSTEERYLDAMKKLQFDTYDMIVEAENNSFRFTVQHHFEKMLRMCSDRYHPSRVKRLAQEAVTLSTSLPLSYSSSVFVRCDTDRLDIMKVLITGPAETPYANGCFEFDVFFPPDYPTLPMMINLETTGRHSVRFNPNLYNDGKVCLSVLNTWHGRPEEKWNAQTSSFLQVLVSIQSLILVPEPYFNEPGFERSRGTPSGTHSSREYNSNIYQACVRWAMLEQIRNPSPCFKEVIHKHFWMKRDEICDQIEQWIEELNQPIYSERNNRTISFNAMVLRRQYRHLREELAKLKPPEGMEDLEKPFDPNVNLPNMVALPPPVGTAAAAASNPATMASAAISAAGGDAPMANDDAATNEAAAATATENFDKIPKLVSMVSPLAKNTTTANITSAHQSASSNNVTINSPPIGFATVAAIHLKSPNPTQNQQDQAHGGEGVGAVRDGAKPQQQPVGLYANATAAGVDFQTHVAPDILMGGVVPPPLPPPQLQPNEETAHSAAATDDAEMHDSNACMAPGPAPVITTPTDASAHHLQYAAAAEDHHMSTDDEYIADDAMHVDDVGAEMQVDPAQQMEDVMQID